MELKQKIQRTIKEHGLIESGDKVVLGFSGGPDSLVLLHVLFSLNRDYEESGGKKGIAIKLYPVHINHKFRPGAAEEDQKFSEEFSENLGLRCRTFEIDCNKLAGELKIGSEEAGRKARYDSFREVASTVLKEISGEMPEEEAKKQIKIAVAQNANDQAETILFRILRGTGTDGLSGIPYLRQDESGYNIVRPLLDITREEIEAYCEKEGLEPRRDHTNDEAIYTRNKIRLELIPYMRDNFNPSIIGALNRLAESAAGDRAYIYGQAKSAFEEAKLETNQPIISLKTEKLALLDRSVRYRVYNIALYEIGMKENVTSKFLEAIDKIRLSQNHTRAYTELTGGYRVMREKKKLIFYKNGEYGEF